MNIAMIDEHLENIDRRLTHLEQILPTLATREEMQEGNHRLTILIENQNDKINLLIDFVHTLRPKPSGE